MRKNKIVRKQILEHLFSIMSPGKPLRAAIDRIQEANLGAIIVLGDPKKLSDVMRGGFELNTAYTKQQQELNGAGSTPIQSTIATDSNGRTALVLGASFDSAWSKLASALPKLGFEIKEETGSRGIRELEYKPLSQEEWQRIGMPIPNLEGGTYQMQLAAVGKQSAVVISDENKTALSGEQAQIIYQALQNVLAR